MRRQLLLAAAAAIAVLATGAGGDGVALGQSADPQSLPQGYEGKPYRLVLPGDGGTPPYDWSIDAGGGELPPGITISTQGELVGVPERRGIYLFMIRFADNGGQSLKQPVSIEVLPPQTEIVPLRIRSERLPDAVAGHAYHVALAHDGGAPPYRWTVGGTPPPGMTLEPTTGVLSGVPSDPGSYSLDLRLDDGRDVAAGPVELKLTVLEQAEIQEASERHLADWWKYLGLALILAGYILGKQGINDRFYFQRRSILLDAGLRLEQNKDGSFMGGPQAAIEAFRRLGRQDSRRVLVLRIGFATLGLLFFLYVVLT